MSSILSHLSILLIADHFPPSFAPRMGFLTKNLAMKGHTVTVVASLHHRDMNSFGHLEGYATTVKDVKVFLPSWKRLGVLLSNLFGYVVSGRKLWTMSDDRAYRLAIDEVKNNSFDCILVSTSNFFPLMAASRVAEETGLPIFVDIRDIYEQAPSFWPMNGISGRLRKAQIPVRNLILSKARAVTTVSKWNVDMLRPFNPNTLLIYNGYDSTMFRPTEPVPTTHLTISFTGTISTPTGSIEARNPELLFKTLRVMISEGIDVLGKIRVLFYTDAKSRDMVLPLVAKYGLQECVELHPWVSALEVSRILPESNILLLLADNRKLKGVLTTKFFEYMATQRPIICLPCSGGVIGEILDEAGAGVCFDDVQPLKDYLSWSLKTWTENSCVLPNAKSRLDYIRSFTRQYQATQFEQLFHNMI
ncbi:MAG: hypothetical protein HUJ96_00125 [Marinilabiliaceae bacterium]|nr:hypothetical protein [Marinilabiliaceae bacterium]